MDFKDALRRWEWPSFVLDIRIILTTRRNIGNKFDFNNAKPVSTELLSEE